MSEKTGCYLYHCLLELGTQKVNVSEQLDFSFSKTRGLDGIQLLSGRNTKFIPK
jgi:hypothetical protein